MDTTISVSNLSKTFKVSKKQRKLEKSQFNIKIAVSNVSFNTYAGEIFGLLGPNGAGKTTTLRMISTLMKPDCGEIKVLNYDISDEENVKKHIGFLTNELKLENSFTPNYLFNYFGKLRNMSEEEISKRRDLLFKKFGINKFSEMKISDLSTGMKQKVSIVLSIIHDPDIVIFDEPTLGLDVLTAKVIIDFLLELKSLGKTVIISSHIMSIVEKICDRVGIIIDGELIVCDTVENVKKISPSNNLEESFFLLYEERHRGENI